MPPWPILTSGMLCDPAMEEKITCCVCHDIYQAPKSSNCGHTACEECWLRVFHEGYESCPLCRSEVNPGGLHVNPAMEMLMGMSRVKCQGCCWEGPFETYAAHLDDCPAKQLAERDAQIAERDVKIEELSTALAQSRSDHSLDVEAKQEALKDVLESSSAELRECHERIATISDVIRDQSLTLRKQDKQLKANAKALEEQRVKFEEEARESHEVLTQVLAAHDDYKNHVEREMLSYRKTFETAKANAAKRVRSCSPSAPKVRFKK